MEVEGYGTLYNNEFHCTMGTESKTLTTWWANFLVVLLLVVVIALGSCGVRPERSDDKHRRFFNLQEPLVAAYRCVST